MILNTKQYGLYQFQQRRDNAVGKGKCCLYPQQPEKVKAFDGGLTDLDGNCLIASF